MEKETIQSLAQIMVPVLTFLLGLAATYITIQRKQRKIDREDKQMFQKHLEIIVASIMSCNGFGEKFRKVYYENLKLNNLQSTIKITEEQ